MSESMWMAALVVVALVCLVAVLLPLLGRRRTWAADDATDLDRLFDAKARVLRAIKDLDHEHGAGLLTDDDWRAARDEHVAEAVRLNREVAELTGVEAPAEVEEVRR